MRIGIDKKFGILTISIIIVLGLTLGHYMNHHQALLLRGELEDRANLLIKNLAYNVEYPVLINDQENIARLVEGVMSQRDVESCRITDKRSKIIYQSGLPAPEGVREFVWSVITEKNSDEMEEDLMFGGEPEKEEIGKIHLFISTSSLDRELSDGRKTIIQVVIGAILATSLLSSILFRLLVSRPVNRLVRATEKIAKGELNVNIPVNTNDEFAILSNSFNMMTGELLKHRHELEELVKKRTEELEKVNEQLSVELSERRKTENALREANKELRKSQEQLVQSEKMASLGQLVAGVAHEINTPIGIGVTAASHLMKTTTEIKTSYENQQMTKSSLESYFSDASEISGLILTHLNRTSELIRSFKMVSADQTSHDKRIFNIKSYLEDIVISLQPKTKRTNHSIKIICPDDIEIDSYPGAFAQVITNLILNSMIHGLEDREKGEIVIEVTVRDESLHISHSDNGKGIDQLHINKIFDPFFTTKRGSGGTGLGLHIVYNTVTHTLNGTISCNSVVNEGTIFVIAIPIILEQP